MQKRSKQFNKIVPNRLQNLLAEFGLKTPQDYKDKKTRAKYECNEQLAEMIEQANLLPPDFHFSITLLFEKNVSSSLLTPVRIYELIFSLPEDVQKYIFSSNELKDSEKQDAYEYWLNNDGAALDILYDLNLNEEISDETYKKLYGSSADEIAEFLVDFGYYGDDYSYEKQIAEEEKEERGYSSFFDSEYDSDFETRNLLKALKYTKPLEKLQNIRDFLLAIINLAKTYETTINQENSDSFFIRQDQKKLTELAIKEFELREVKEKVLAANISINDKGEIQFSISDWATALQGVDITRIRLCDVCNKIFWANRRDAFACSKKHAKTRQMRLLRANWKEKESLYLNARKRKKEKKKNGSL